MPYQQPAPVLFSITDDRKLKFILHLNDNRGALSNVFLHIICYYDCFLQIQRGLEARRAGEKRASVQQSNARTLVSYTFSGFHFRKLVAGSLIISNILVV
jgi:hypothetical protein